VRSNAPADFHVRLLHGGEVVAEAPGPELTAVLPGTPGAYRVEIRTADAVDAPLWILSNPIYVGPAAPREETGRRADARTQMTLISQDTSRWRVEHDPTSLGALDVATVDVDRPALAFRYGLSGGDNVGQFAAAVVETPEGLADADALELTARADRPMRVSVQFRVAVTPDRDEAWQRSIYLDVDARTTVVSFDDLRPVGETRTALPPLTDVHSIVFVVGGPNTGPGASGRVWLDRALLERVRSEP
jgi:hypothetical protein